ncbi:MAG: hypothetical protein ABI336_12980 [Humibacillus sp.]
MNRLSAAVSFLTFGARPSVLAWSWPDLVLWWPRVAGWSATRAVLG